MYLKVQGPNLCISFLIYFMTYVPQPQSTLHYAGIKFSPTPFYKTHIKKQITEVVNNAVIHLIQAS